MQGTLPGKWGGCKYKTATFWHARVLRLEGDHIYILSIIPWNLIAANVAFSKTGVELEVEIKLIKCEDGADESFTSGDLGSLKLFFCCYSSSLSPTHTCTHTYAQEPQSENHTHTFTHLQGGDSSHCIFSVLYASKYLWYLSIITSGGLGSGAIGQCPVGRWTYFVL